MRIDLLLPDGVYPVMLDPESVRLRLVRRAILGHSSIAFFLIHFINAWKKRQREADRGQLAKVANFDLGAARLRSRIESSMKFMEYTSLQREFDHDTRTGDALEKSL